MRDTTLYLHIFSSVSRYNNFYTRSRPDSVTQIVLDGLQDIDAITTTPEVFGRADIFFKGNFGGGQRTCQGHRVDSCSAGIRPWIKGYLTQANVIDSRRVAGFETAVAADGNTVSGSGNASGVAAPISFPVPSSVVDSSQQSEDTKYDMKSAWFALCPAGIGCWSSRLFDAISSLTIPVILSNGAVQPFASLLNYSEFSVTIDTDPFVTSVGACAAAVIREASAEQKLDPFSGRCPLGDSAAERAGAAAAGDVLKETHNKLDHMSSAVGSSSSQWSGMHLWADAIREHCSPSSSSLQTSEDLPPENGFDASLPVACEALLPVQMMRRLAEVSRIKITCHTRRSFVLSIDILKPQHIIRCENSFSTTQASGKARGAFF